MRLGGQTATRQPEVHRLPAPVRAVLEAETYADAKFRSIELTGKAIQPRLGQLSRKSNMWRS